MKLLDAVSLAVAVAFAAPAALLGVETLLGGDPTGWVFLAFAAGILGFERYVVTPDDIPAMFAQKTASAVVEDPDDEPRDDGESGTQ
ncbi:DUF7533 family protein [Halobacterium jilantaiense]|uniref:Uncharacterized protein n=1 Tax=Halobacterium jilantaiense TaxID=355548 RepID=A0A1I0PBI2_9EURY|nr:hypothetical protein [Halobacterium jilantaiense]SEW11711.1 hypothetical protein SAMN04487945_1568 [Halobacterium jilantaiense]